MGIMWLVHFMQLERAEQLVFKDGALLGIRGAARFHLLHVESVVLACDKIEVARHDSVVVVVVAGALSDFGERGLSFCFVLVTRMKVYIHQSKVAQFWMVEIYLGNSAFFNLLDGVMGDRVELL